MGLSMAERQVIFQLSPQKTERVGSGRLPSNSLTEPSSEVGTGENLLRNGFVGRHLSEVMTDCILPIPRKMNANGKLCDFYGSGET